MDKGVILYGAGYRGQSTFIDLCKENIHVEAFADKNAKKIIKHCGCLVYTMEEALSNFHDYPFIVTIDNQKANQEIFSRLKNEKIEVYDSFEDFYQGKRQAEVPLTKCGDAAPYQVYSPLLHEGAIAYTFGIGFDYSFEIELAKKYKMDVFSFDPSPEVVERLKNENTIHYYPYGIANIDEVKSFYKPRYNDNYSEYFSYWTKDADKIEMEVYRLASLLKKFGHNHIDLLKMDVEGTEFNVLEDVLNELDINQICIETHARIFPDSIDKIHEVRRLFSENGYLLVFNGRHEHTYIKKELL